MKYNNATCGQRFGAYLIDMIIVSLISSLILVLIPAYQVQSEIFIKNYSAILDFTVEIDDSVLSDLMSSAVIIGAINMAIMLPLMAIYFVLIPHFWKQQTVGRAALGLRVVTLNEETPKWTQLCLRELVGSYLIYEVLGNVGIVFIITWVLSANNGRSIVDYVGQTRLVNVRYVKETEETPENPFQDYVDAKFHEVEPKNEENEIIPEYQSPKDTSDEPDTTNNDSSSADDYKIV